MRHFYHAFFLAILLPLAGSAQQMLPATGEFRVNQNVPSDQLLPQIAVGPSDDYIVVWKSWQQDDATASIYFRRYNSAHIALSPETLVATGASQNEDHVVKVIYWTDGKYIIAWNDGSNVNMRVLNTNNTLTATVPLAGNSQWDIAVRGNTLAILYGSGNAELNLRGYDLGINNFIGPAVLATEDAGNDYDLPNIRFRNDGSLVAVYGRGNYPNRIYRKTFDSDFLAQINETIVHDQNSSLNCIDVSTNASDQILISTKWGVNGTDVYQVWLLDANGTAILDQLGTFSCAYAYYTAECTLFDNGDFVVVMGNWLSLVDPDDYQVRGIYSHNYNAQSTGAVVMNTTTAGRQTYPAVEKRGDGGFVVVWEGNGFQGDTQGINARAYSGATFPGVQAVSTATVTVDETMTSQTIQLRLGSQPTGDVIIDLSVSDATEASIDVAQMTFTTSDWDQPQTVTVTGVDDPADDGDIDLDVVSTMNVLTADAQYAAMPPTFFAVVNLDDDATFTLPIAQTFCRNEGMANVNVLINNAGLPITEVQGTSSDQAIVDDADITVTPVNTTTFSFSITGLDDNVPGTAQIIVTAMDGLFVYTDQFTVNTLGDVPVITQNGGDLSTTPGVAYQWFVDGSFIPDGTEQTYSPTQNGEYTVLVIDADGCYNNSAPFLYNSTGVGALSASVLWAGPLTDVLPLRAPEAGSLRVLDATGKVVATQRVMAGMQTLSLPGLAPGAYTLLLNQAKAVRVVKE
ncbi:MAG TPA: hypothetical protein VKG92_08965 [Flavobacteriales bacterium]|nr:hypothetical protein [Flavobacteriales bacterium]